MPYVQIPKDLNNIKEKKALGFTKRQLIFFPIGVIFGFTAFFLTKSISMELSLVLLLSLAMPSFFFASYEKNGMHLEKMLKHYVKANFFNPKVRTYKTENVYAKLDKQIQTDKELKMIGEENSIYSRKKGEKKFRRKA